MKPPAFLQAACLLVVRDTVTVNLIVPYGIAVLAAGVTGIAFHGIDPAIFHTFDDAHMVGFPSDVFCEI